MTDYPILTEFEGAYGGATMSTMKWATDEDPATVLTMLPGSEVGYAATAMQDYREFIDSINGLRVEFDFVSGSGHVNWRIDFDNAAWAFANQGGYFAVGDFAVGVPVVPGTTFTHEVTRNDLIFESPYYPFSYPNMVRSVANRDGINPGQVYSHAYMELKRDSQVSGPAVVVSRYRYYFHSPAPAIVGRPLDAIRIFS